MGTAGEFRREKQTEKKKKKTYEKNKDWQGSPTKDLLGEFVQLWTWRKSFAHIELSYAPLGPREKA